MKKTLLFLTLIMGSLAVRAQEAPQEAAPVQKGPKIEQHISEIADGYDFWLVEPADTKGKKPLVIFLHGASLKGTNLDKVKRYGTLDAVIKGREIDAYVVAPQVPSGSWKPEKIKEVLDYVILTNPNVDTDRIYVTGMSLGGYGTLDFAATYPDVVAAAAAFCGGSTKKDMSGLNEVPLWIVHGTADRDVAVEKSDKVVSAIKETDSKAPRLVYDRVPGMNHSRPARIFYLPELYEWLFSHSLKDEGRPLQKQPVKISDSVLNDAYKGINFRKK